MQVSPLLVYVVGFIAQAFFSARTLVQWILSEKAHKVLSPSIFWVLSLAGSVLLFTYGWMRHDFSIILGQIISYYIYIWNLDIKGIWHRIPLPLRWAVMSLPVAAVTLMLSDAARFVSDFLNNDYVPLPLLIFGSAGQIIFTLRFVYQWYYSYRLKQSVLPVGFWLISLIGSGIIIAYGIFRLDPVLILGQSVGFIAYIRNIILFRKEKHSNTQQQETDNSL